MDSKVTRAEDHPLLAELRQLTSILDDTNKSPKSPVLTYLRDFFAMAATPRDVKILPDAEVFTVDMSCGRFGEIKVELVADSTLVVSCERMWGEAEQEEKYLMMERWLGKAMRKYKLPGNANTDAISPVYKNGVLTVTVEKLPPRELKDIEVKNAEGSWLML